MAGETVVLGGVTLTKYACPAEYRKFVPPPEDYEPQGDELRAIALAHKYHHPLLLEGPAGCGKNAAIRHAAHILNRPLHVLSFAEGTGLDQLIGVMVPKGLPDGGFTVVWSDGAFPRAIKQGAWLVADELNAGDERVTMRVHDFLAKGDRLFMYENAVDADGFVTPYDAKGNHNGFTLLATMNPADTGMYAGTKVLNEATLDRFLVQEMDYLGLTDPNREAEAISRAAKVKLSKARRIVDVFNQVRRRARMTDEELAKAQSHAIFAVASTRRAIFVAIYSKEMPMMQAAELGFISKVNKDDRPVIHKLFADQFAADDTND